MQTDRPKLVATCAGIFVMFSIIFFAVQNANSETLNEESLRKLYAEADEYIRDPRKSEEFMRKRFDDNYIRQGQLIRGAKGKQDEVIPISQNKEQAIAAILQGMNGIKIEKYDHTIQAVKFSADNQYAYVSSVETTSGSFSTPGVSRTIDIDFNEGGACVDTWSLVKMVVKLMRSECTNKIVSIGPR